MDEADEKTLEKIAEQLAELLIAQIRIERQKVAFKKPISAEARQRQKE